jgi:epsilon-lactone hydrolase
MMKKTVRVLLACFLSLSLTTAAFAEENIVTYTKARMIDNGDFFQVQDAPIKVDGVLFIPLREFFVHLGVSNDDEHIQWDQTDKSVTLTKGKDKVEVTVGSKTALINGLPVELEAAPLLHGSPAKTYVPLNFLNNLIFITEISDKAAEWADKLQVLQLLSVPKITGIENFVDTFGKSILEHNQEETDKINQTINDRFFGKNSEFQFTPVDANGVPSEWMSKEDSKKDKVVLFLHGGGYNRAALGSFRAMPLPLLKATGYKALLVDYRGLPGSIYPDGLNDAVTAYQWLLDQGYKSSDIVLFGESAGGGLVLATALKLKEKGTPLPGAIISLSPFADLTITQKSVDLASDFMLSKESIKMAAKLYAGNEDPKNPLVSPFYGDYTGFPPLLIQAGEKEVFRDDAKGIADKAKKAGVDVSVKIFEGVGHVFQILGEFSPEGKQAYAEMAEFLNKHMKP